MDVRTRAATAATVFRAKVVASVPKGIATFSTIRYRPESLAYEVAIKWEFNDQRQPARAIRQIVNTPTDDVLDRVIDALLRDIAAHTDCCFAESRPAKSEGPGYKVYARDDSKCDACGETAHDPYPCW